LPATAAEARDISRLAAADPTTILTGRAATKTAIAHAAEGRRIVHLATHAFFLSGGCELAGSNRRGAGGLVRPAGVGPRSSNPLLLAGLAFAGANSSASPNGAGTGILTAEEVVSLNLQGTEWVVLSACDTGLGQVEAGEGVFGLRRAFQIAGARTVIMSLWSVEDESTRQWMRALYDARFQQHMTTADAVRAATLRTLSDRRRRGQSTHPFYWAGFIAAGDWR
jgi:CHAT domain-containing protein